MIISSGQPRCEVAVLRRRMFLAGGAGAVATLSVACSSADTATAPPSDLPGRIAELRNQFLERYDEEYVDNAIVPHFLNRQLEGQRPVLPMIDVALTKENALPFRLWGLLSKTWKPDPEQGVTVFLQGLEKRGPHNLRKRI
ncbi:MAG: hypothetical protein WBO08_17355 [Mycobacterium sp.]|nr:hypothetical protein [Mycobacterium sp.]